MNSRALLKKTLNHQQPERLTVDFGGTAVTGIHVKAIKELRKYYRLKEVPVKVTEPFQMLGEIDDELRDAMGVDVIGAYGRDNIFGFANTECEWKPFTSNWGQELEVPVDFLYKRDIDGSLLMYPAGDNTVEHNARMPESGYFFDAIIRQEPIDEERLNPEDNLEEFAPVSEETIAYWKRTIDNLEGSQRGIIASIGGTALGDIALVPGMNLRHPKGIRDVAEWYMSTVMRPDYIHAIPLLGAFSHT